MTLYNNIHHVSKAKNFIVYICQLHTYKHKMASLDALDNYDAFHTIDTEGLLVQFNWKGICKV
jgi:hypothetical protein